MECSAHWHIIGAGINSLRCHNINTNTHGKITLKDHLKSGPQMFENTLASYTNIIGSMSCLMKYIKRSLSMLAIAAWRGVVTMSQNLPTVNFSQIKWKIMGLLFSTWVTLGERAFGQILTLSDHPSLHLPWPGMEKKQQLTCHWCNKVSAVSQTIAIYLSFWQSTWNCPKLSK